jgi:hypothetical protein
MMARAVGSTGAALAFLAGERWPERGRTAVAAPDSHHLHGWAGVVQGLMGVEPEARARPSVVTRRAGTLWFVA